MSDVAGTSRQTRRYLAVDLMRGLTVVLMIVVNMAISPEKSFPLLLHSVWDGFTFADAVFPTFLFVTGTALALSFDRPAADQPGWSRVFRRALLLFLVGLFISNFPFGHLAPDGGWEWTDPSRLRFLGVLQRIALCYGICSLVVRLGGSRAAWAFMAGALVANWLIATLAGDLTLAGSAALKVDLATFGPTHLYQGEGQPFDPEGLLGTLPSCVNVLSGYLAMRALRAAESPMAAARRLFPIGIMLVAAALFWHLSLPINKKLWSSSFVLLTVGIDLIVLAAIVVLVDGLRLRRGTGLFATFGRNPLALYVLSEVLMALAWTIRIGDQSLFLWLFDHVFAGARSGRWGSFAFGLALVGLCWLAGRALERRSLYLRL